MSRRTILTPNLIDDICDLVSRGAVDHVVCQIVGIHRSTLWDWKRRGQQPDSKAIYQAFWLKYQQACGERVLRWIEGVKDERWLLEHHPDSKEDFRGVSILKSSNNISEVKDPYDSNSTMAYLRTRSCKGAY